jgi:PAS domain S-box-containing protein
VNPASTPPSEPAREWAELRARLAQAEATAERLRLAQEAADAGSWEWNLRTNQNTWSEQLWKLYGLAPHSCQPSYEAWLATVHPEDRAQAARTVLQAATQGADLTVEWRVLDPNGRVRWLAARGRPQLDEEGCPAHYIGIVSDITERKRAEEALRQTEERLRQMNIELGQRVAEQTAELRQAKATLEGRVAERTAELQQLNRTLEALKKSSQAMLRAQSESEYLQEVCHNLIANCGHAMVWIGFAEQDEQQRVRPVASCGFEAGYLETLAITWADTERGRGPTGTAIRTGKPCACKDMLTDPAFAPWRADALKRGYASSLVLPLLAEGKAFGAITLYSCHPAGFSDNEVELLSQLADDVAYCVRSLRAVAERQRAEEQLRLLSTAVESAANGVVITDRQGRILWSNPAFTRLTGYSQAESVGQPSRLLKSGAHPSEFYHKLWKTILRGEPWQGEMVNRRKDGSLYYEEITITPVRASGTEITHFVAIKQDVTARKRAEQRTDLLAETASHLLQSESPQRIVDGLCRRLMAFLDCEVFFNFLVDEAAGQLHLNACAGVPEAEARKIEWLDYGVAVCGCAARDACRIVAEEVQHTADPRTVLIKSFGIEAYACHPLIVEGRLLGTLSFGTRTRTRFTEEELSLMKVVADQVAIAMERRRVQEELRRANAELEQRVVARTTEVRASEARYRSLVTATAQIVWTTDPQGQIIAESPTWQAFTGQSLDQYRGTGWVDAVHPEDRQRTQVAWLGAVAARDLYETEYRMRRQDGHYRHILARGVPILEPDGSIREWVGTCTDITDHKEAERRREFTSALLALFARKSSANDYLNSVVEIIREWSGCQALGIRLKNEQQEIPYESWAGFEPGFLELERRLSLERDHCFCIRAIAGTCEGADRPLLTRGGSFRTDDAIGFARTLAADQLRHYRGNCMKFGFTSLAVIPIRYREEVIGALHLADRRPGQFPLASVEFIESITPLIGEALHRFHTEAELAQHRDHLEVLVRQRTSELEAANARLQSEIAERQRAQEALQKAAVELKRSNGDLEQFAYIASHDLQEPLRAVGGYVKLLARRFPQHLDPKALEYINGAAEGATRMERLITDLLAFSRVGTKGGEFVPTDLNGILNEALHNLQTTIRTTKAKVTHDPLPTLRVDATQIMQLFQNLVGNAIKFRGEPPPEIHLGARQEAGRWTLSVRDNGIGIEPQYFARIFQIFQRLHTRKHYPGTGIGLAICKKIVERHGGTIGVESAPGQGSVFYFTLPEAAPHNEPAL